MRDFSDILNEAMEREDRTSGWLSRKTGISRSTIGDYRAGKTTPTIHRAKLIAGFISIDLTQVFEIKEVIKDAVRKGHEEVGRTLLMGKEGVKKVFIYPDSFALLASLNQSENGLTIDLSMSKNTIPIAETQHEEGMFAVKIDQSCDCDEDYGIAIGVPWKGHIEEGKPILFTTNPPSKLVIRRVLVHEDGRFIFKESYLGSNSIHESKILVIAALKLKIEHL